MLKKETVKDRIEILEDGSIQIREVTRILEDGVIISQKNTNRYVLSPGDDITKEEDRIKNLVNVVHTKEVVDKYKAKQAKIMEKEQKHE